MKEVDEELLFKCLRGKTTGRENIMINEWIGADEKNAAMYRNACRIYEGFLMSDAYQDDSGMVSLPSGRRRDVLRFVRNSIAFAAAFALFCVLGFHLIRNRLETELANTINTIDVPAGRSMDYTLSDGTVVKLNSGTRMQFPVAFAKDCREVYLEGEAYFDVTHNAEKPFIVRTFASDIEVLGTEFNVNADSEEGKFSATLIEGSIRLSNSMLPGEHVVMYPNEKVVLVNNHMVLTEHDPKSDIIWTKGFIDISGLDFGQLMRKFEKAFGVKIIIDHKMPSGPVFDNGKLRISDGIDNALGTIRKGGIEFMYSKDNRNNTIYIK